MLWKYSSSVTGEEETSILYCDSGPLSFKIFFPNPTSTVLWTESAEEPQVRNVQVTPSSCVNYFVSSPPDVCQLKRKKHPADSILNLCLKDYPSEREQSIFSIWPLIYSPNVINRYFILDRCFLIVINYFILSRKKNS